ncbi:MAG: hypothetical protein CMJ41_06535 [Phycisphaerae bacterium]|nr:hypothetical protein [Phycisphaerae bacterium]HBZ97302.1 hypothetical protein [Phycisphaerales bacterium]|tara:strand:+ start:282 stop:1700 length:1419 start_codon:yes stop_codon:yes gene_type:complete
MTSDRLTKIRELLEAHEQSHLLGGWDRLDETAREALLNQLQLLPWETIDVVRESIQHRVESNPPPSNLEPPQTCDPAGPDAAGFFDRGAELIAAGRVAAFTVAGGQGTRLGWNGPKGTFPATAVSGKPLFAIFAEQLRAAQRRYDVVIPWYIMTSPLNDAATRAFFLDNKCFGLHRSNIMMFPQGTMPSFDARTGDLLLASPGVVAENPDGHGGALDAMARSGALADMESRGITIVSSFQVDNPLVRVVDECFIGMHESDEHSSAEVSSKMVLKEDPSEPVGVFCRVDGRTHVVEYSDLPSDLAEVRNGDGSLRFGAASIAVHLYSVPFVSQLTGQGGDPLPWHRALKKSSWWDAASGAMVEPEGPNVIKLERFIFDIVPRAERSAILRTERSHEFAPIKNATGPDSLETSQQIQSDLYGGWLRQHGVQVPQDDAGRTTVRIEIEPLTAMRPGDLAGSDLPAAIEPGGSLLL